MQLAREVHHRRISWSLMNVVECRLRCPECGAAHDKLSGFNACLAGHGIAVRKGLPVWVASGAPYTGGPGGEFVVVGAGGPVFLDRFALEAALHARAREAQALRAPAAGWRVCDGLEHGLSESEVEQWLAVISRRR